VTAFESEPRAERRATHLCGWSLPARNAGSRLRSRPRKARASQQPCCSYQNSQHFRRRKASAHLTRT